MDYDQEIFERHAENHRRMHSTEKERCAEVNKTLNKEAFEAAWNAYQNTGIDLVADSDDETCRCVHNAIVAYLSAPSSLRSAIVSATKAENMFWLGEALLSELSKWEATL